MRKFTDVIRKKRRQKPNRSYITGTSKYESESDDGPEGDVFAFGASAGTTNENTQRSSWTTDPDLPYVASGYVQLVFNIFLVGVALYIGLAFIRTIQRDVDQKVEEYSAGILVDYIANSRNPPGNRSVLQGIFREPVRAGYACPSHGKSLPSMGKMHEQRSKYRWSSKSIG